MVANINSIYATILGNKLINLAKTELKNENIQFKNPKLIVVSLGTGSSLNLETDVIRPLKGSIVGDIVYTIKALSYSQIHISNSILNNICGEDSFCNYHRIQVPICKGLKEMDNSANIPKLQKCTENFIKSSSKYKKIIKILSNKEENNEINNNPLKHTLKLINNTKKVIFVSISNNNNNPEDKDYFLREKLSNTAKKTIEILDDKLENKIIEIRACNDNNDNKCIKPDKESFMLLYLLGDENNLNTTNTIEFVNNNDKIKIQIQINN